MKCSIAAENAANPVQPIIMALGPAKNREKN